MSQTTYSNPRLFSGKREILNFNNITYKNQGKNTVSTLQIKIDDPQLDSAALLGNEVVFYLNYGSIDTVPFFRGYIRQVNPTDKNITLTAHDVLSFLSGVEAPPLTITDRENYDGFTITRMLYDYISTTVNKNKTVVGLDMLNDTDPHITMTGFRNDSIVPLKVVQNLLKQNTSTTTDIKNTRITVRDDGIKSNVCFVLF